MAPLTCTDRRSVLSPPQHGRAVPHIEASQVASTSNCDANTLMHFTCTNTAMSLNPQEILFLQFCCCLSASDCVHSPLRWRPAISSTSICSGSPSTLFFEWMVKRFPSRNTSEVTPAQCISHKLWDCLCCLHIQYPEMIRFV